VFASALWGLTFKMSGIWKRAKHAGSCPLDGWIRPSLPELQAREDGKCDNKPHDHFDEPGRTAPAPRHHRIELSKEIVCDNPAIDQCLSPRIL
jgi:hypothetical protein